MTRSPFYGDPLPHAKPLPHGQRYMYDALFHAMVDSLVYFFEDTLATPADVRDALMLAEALYEKTCPHLMHCGFTKGGSDART